MQKGKTSKKEKRIEVSVYSQHNLQGDAKQCRLPQNWGLNLILSPYLVFGESSYNAKLCIYDILQHFCSMCGWQHSRKEYEE